MSPGARLKYIGETTGISLIDAAVEFGISISKLERIENNKIPLPLMVAMQAAELYNCSLDDFSELRNRPLPPNKRLRIS